MPFGEITIHLFGSKGSSITATRTAWPGLMPDASSVNFGCLPGSASS